MPEDFTWRDGERTIRFGRGALADAPSLLGEGYLLLTTVRALGSAPQIGAASSATLLVGAGRVEDLATDLLERTAGEGRIVALGGGRVIDVAKALAAAAQPQRVVAAIPTTLSAAEMSWVHRHAHGVHTATPKVRPDVVINDPALSASQPLPALAASAANALAHAVEAACTTLTSPVPTLAAVDAARRLARALPVDGEPDRDGLALGALLAGYSLDASWYGLHHVMSQTLVRGGGVGHGEANAGLLPVTAAALRRRRPERLAELDEALGRPVEEVARRFAVRAGVPSLRAIGIDEEALSTCAEAAAKRSELALTPPPADAREIEQLYREAW
ncbi:MAG: iron-containing alcohol dehydrogenase [Solirubrobacteraceae bacterium]|nr:iron-containing alcohol dehydrogenase [Solirubrobacteraceae bacterium]